MKKRIAKKLTLNKKTISDLSRMEMGEIKGASFMIPSCGCSDRSCSFIQYCCPPTTEGDELLNDYPG